MCGLVLRAPRPRSAMAVPEEGGGILQTRRRQPKTVKPAACASDRRAPEKAKRSSGQVSCDWVLARGH